MKAEPVPLERRVYILTIVSVVQFAILVGLCLSRFSVPNTVAAQTRPEILTVRGLVIEDDQGRPRILLGAPFPAVKQRIRQDARTTSILFLDANGHDRLTLGEELQPQIGGKVPVDMHRIASGFGVVLHDDRGDERGAYSWLSNGRALITLDRPGAEAFAAMVNDRTGETKVSLEFPPEVANDTSAIELGTRASQAFLSFKNKKGGNLALFQTLGGSSLSFKTFDTAGRSSPELLREIH